MQTTELLVIGGGPGGYAAAIRAGQCGLDVTLVEKDALGGTCLNYGCIPSKALLSASSFAHDAEHANRMGIYAEPYVDFGEMVAWKDDVVTQLTGGVDQLCRAAGVRLIDGIARFESENEATIELPDGDTDSIEFEHAIVATGSRPIEIEGFSFSDDPILDSRQALALEEVPLSLLVVGAGYIGMELSAVFAKLGTEVTVVEMLDSVLPGYDADVTKPVRSRAEDLGIEFVFGYAADEWQHGDHGVRVVAEDADGTTETFDAERVLVAVGRTPVTDTLNLDALNITLAEDGFIETDELGRTSLNHVFAVGDVAGEPMLAHKASHEGILAAEASAGNEPAPSVQPVPSAVFTDPEIATVGYDESAARDAGFDPVVGEFPFAASGRAQTIMDTEGFVRLVASDSGRILGGQIVGPEASELIAEVGLAIRCEATLEEFADTIHTHPTLSEATMEAAEHALGQAIHTANR